MKLKLDENLPISLTNLLKSLGHDVHTTGEEGLAGASDRQIWESAPKESRFFITQDMDFSDLRKFFPDTHCGILLIRLHTPSRKRIAARINEIFVSEDVPTWVRCFVVVTDSKVRVVRPQRG